MKTHIIFCLVILALLFGGIYLFYLKKTLLLPKKKEKKKKEKTKGEYQLNEFRYLNIKFNIKNKYLMNKKMIALISLIDSLIITTTIFIVLILNIHYIFQLLIGFVLVISLIYSIYEILGRILVKRGYDK